MVIGASNCHLNVGEVFVHQFHVLVIGYDFRLGDDEIAHALAVQLLDGAAEVGVFPHDLGIEGIGNQEQDGCGDGNRQGHF